MEKHCENCAHGNVDMCVEPCKSCTADPSKTPPKWEPRDGDTAKLLDELEKLGALCHAAEKDRDLALVRAEQAEAEADGLILDRAELRKHVEHLTAERDSLARLVCGADGICILRPGHSGGHCGLAEPPEARYLDEIQQLRTEVERLRTIVATVTAQVKAWRSLPGDALKPYDVLLRLEATLAGKGPRKKVKP